MTEQHASDEAVIDDSPMVAPIDQATRESTVDAALSRDDHAHKLDRLHAWRDANEWLKLVGPMREGAQDFGPEIPVETLALVFYAVRRLEGQQGSLTRSRVLAATRPDADLVMELARTTDHALETARHQLADLRQQHTALKTSHATVIAAVYALGEEIRDQVFKQEKASLLTIIERLDTIRSL